MASNFKEFKVKVTVDTKDGNKQIEQNIKSLKDYEKVIDDLNKKKAKPGISQEELAAIDKEIKQMGTDFQNAGNKILLVNQDLDVTAKNLKALQKEQKTFAVGSDEYRKAADKIADFKDKLEGAKRTQIGLGEQLEAAPGPLGMFFSGIDKVKNSFTTLGGAIKASGIGLLTAVIGGIVGAFANVEGSGKKLEPLLIGMEKIFGGIMNALQPLLDTLLDLGMKALPYVTKGIGYVYSSFAALFSFIKNIGQSYGTIIKGIFTFDWEMIKKGIGGMGDSFGKAKDTFNETMVAFEEGTKKQTKTQKANADKTKEILQKQLDDQKEAVEKSIQLEVNKFNTSRELLEADLKKRDEIENKKWELEHKGKKVSEETLKLQAENRKKFLDDALKADKEAIEAEKELQDKKFDDNLDRIKTANDTEIALQEEKLKEIEILLGKESEAYKKQQLYIWALKKKGIDDEMNALMAKAESGDMLSKEEWARYDGLKLASLQLGNTIIETNKNELASKKETTDGLKQLEQDKADFELSLTGTTYERKKEILKQQKEDADKRDTDDVAALDTKLKNQQITQEQYDLETGKIELKAKKRHKDNADADKAVDKAKFDLQMDLAQKYADAAGALANLAGKDTIAGKALGIAQALISTYVGAAKALEEPFPFNIIGVATTIATGMKTIQTLTAVTVPDNEVPEVRIRKAMGGILNGPTHAMGGIPTNLGELEGGEYVVNRASTMMFRPQLEEINTAGGGMRDYGYGGFNGGGNGGATPIFKTYVVASDMSDQQELDRIIKDRSKI